MVVARLLTTKFPLACFLMELALQLQRQEADLELFWLPRLQNEKADALTNQCYIAFDPAKRCRSYSATSFPGELLWIPKSLDYAKCEKGTALPGILLNCLHARYFVLFLHSNGEDIGMCHTFASRLRDLLEVHVLLVEFPGYGLCSGKPSEDSLQSAADACFRYVREVLQVAPADIIVMGRSMGAAVALSLAEKFYFGGLVLIAPFLSLRDALGQYTGAKMSEMMLDEVFCNKERIKGVKVPTLVIHGQKDRLIDSSQGQQLFDLCPSRKKLFVCPEEMGLYFDSFRYQTTISLHSECPKRPLTSACVLFTMGWLR
ncbi:unnamed protein product [Cladocopium goreaui]|uniref:Alpha/beta hydrolase domain-containing protein 17A (Abhydrolase domain-containing protein 17A) n=1 Tax=Cladocopium goreaui TaxID=2562237 RepID=A0A9P1CMT9_9DINO|nr:unnamed protein product [Cladocopium goreaui]